MKVGEKQSSCDLDWSQPVTKVEEDKLELDWEDDDEKEDKNSEDEADESKKPVPEVSQCKLPLQGVSKVTQVDLQNSLKNHK